MVEKVTISRISFFDKDKEGNPLKNKDGKPYTRCLIDTTDGRKVSGFANETSRMWHQGDEVEMEIEQSGQYWNFKTIKKEGGGAVNQEQLNDIEKLVTELHQKLIGVTPIVRSNDPNDF